MNNQDPLSISVRQRLLNQATATGEDFNILLARYVGFRFLSRLANSTHAEEFCLKGATMFFVWRGSIHRPTRDIDLLGCESLDLEAVESVVRDICRTPVERDAVLFDEGTISASPIREDNPYGGTRVTVTARIGSARQQLQIDIGYGDAVDSAEVELPSLLANQSPVRMRGYRVETLIAEKFEAMVTLGSANSRMKDFFDLAVIADSMVVESVSLRDAIVATFGRRRIPVPKSAPLAFTDEFWSDETVKSRWSFFVKKNRLVAPYNDLEIVCRCIKAFIGGALGFENADTM